MPLRCLEDNTDILAFNLSPEEWSALRAENAAKRQLRLACCDANVVLKTSRLGTQFFAHAKKGVCTSAAETPEHLLAKSLVAEAAQQAGWTVMTEFRGSTPEGDEWIADVLASKGNAKVAFEIQWSPQDMEATQYRQERYRKSGVRALWLMRQPNILLDADVPTFHLDLNKEAHSFSVWLPEPRIYRAKYLNPRDKGNSSYWRQKIPLDRFVGGALNKRLRFLPAHGQVIRVEVWGASQKCWKCNRWTVIPTGIIFKLNQLIPNAWDARFQFDEFSANSKKPSDYLHHQILAPHLLKRHGIGEIKSWYSKTTEGSYVSNGCFHCDALSGAFFETKLKEREKLIYTVEAVFDKDRLGDWLDHIRGWTLLD